MPAALIPLIAAGVGAGASVYGAKKASDAAHDASSLQQQAGNRAMQVEQQRYQDYQQQMAPYQQAGAQALAQMQQFASQRPAPFQPGQPGGGWQMPPMPQPQGGTVPPGWQPLGGNWTNAQTLTAGGPQFPRGY